MLEKGRSRTGTPSSAYMQAWRASTAANPNVKFTMQWHRSGLAKWMVEVQQCSAERRVMLVRSRHTAKRLRSPPNPQSRWAALPPPPLLLRRHRRCPS